MFRIESAVPYTLTTNSYAKQPPLTPSLETSACKNNESFKKDFVICPNTSVFLSNFGKRGMFPGRMHLPLMCTHPLTQTARKH